jgi:hypothetical protein
VSRRLGAVACLLIVLLATGCGGGGGEKTIATDDLRDCLGKRGATFGATGGGAGIASFFPFAVDFQASIGRTSIAVSTARDTAAARRAAADARSSLGSVGVAPGSGNVMQRRNAVVIFDPAPSPRARAAVRSCLAG